MLTYDKEKVLLGASEDPAELLDTRNRDRPVDMQYRCVLATVFMTKSNSYIITSGDHICDLTGCDTPTRYGYCGVLMLNVFVDTVYGARGRLRLNSVRIKAHHR